MDQLNQLEHLVKELIVKGNLTEIETNFSPNYIAHAAQKTYKGHTFLKQYTNQIRKALPDIKLVQIEILSQNQQRITWQRTFTATHKNNLKGIPPSNKKVKRSEMVVTQFNNSKITEEWVASDLAFQLMLKNK